MKATAAKNEVDGDGLYNELFSWKGMVTNWQSQSRLGRDVTDADTRALLSELTSVNRALASRSKPGSPFQSVIEPAVTLGGPAVRQRLSAPDTKELQARRENLERSLLERSALARREAARTSKTPADLQACLPPSSVLIDFFQHVDMSPRAGNDSIWNLEVRTAAFVVRQDSRAIVRVDLGPTARLATLIERWRGSYGTGHLPPKDQPDPASELRTVLWEPLEKQIGSAKLVLISPDGFLTALPFAALPGKIPGKFLLEEYTIVTTPVPQRLPELVHGNSEVETGPPSMLLVGNVDFDAQVPTSNDRSASTLRGNTQLKPLPGTRVEVDAVHRLFSARFPVGLTTQLNGEQATKDRIVAEFGRHRFLHLATHGLFANESIHSALASTSDVNPSTVWTLLYPDMRGESPGLLSGVVFAGINRSNGLDGNNCILTALEAGDLPLQHTELVVLSACDTGLGRVAGMDGVLGLQRAFQVAGAKAVVASLWSVDDDATRTLMTAFYSNLWEKKLGKAEALRRAQLQILDEYDPQQKRLVPRGGLEIPPGQANEFRRISMFYWAAFVLSGDWR